MCKSLVLSRTFRVFFIGIRMQPLLSFVILSRPYQIISLALKVVNYRVNPSETQQLAQTQNVAFSWKA